ncbi:hypothetical protein JQX13_49010 [Archangium violaceum]|uniref:hypothetical protein n=1 Tax=Archangium violaceum TaxID=83451 RepID=UPI00193C4C96|nr:hypothetical protein [Archangium violaceum]QRK07834.1 hypothetical protein JQX13_49010 [Archangium violaceum]
MTSLSALVNAHPVIGRRWTQDQPSEQARILGLARDALDFISATGQRYGFEDFFKKPGSLRPSHQGENAELKELMGRTKRFFEKLRDEPESAEESAQSQAILDAIRYIESTGQQESFTAFQEYVETNAPPYVVASFDTREEAEAWLANHPNPPDPANVLIANSYHDVFYERETNIRRLPRNRALEWYLAELTEKERPVAVASFETREEADTWWRAPAESSRRAWVRVGDELHLAVYYPNIHHRALFPLSVVSSPEEVRLTPPG